MPKRIRSVAIRQSDAVPDELQYPTHCFFVRHACFLGANDPYSAQKATLKAEIDAEALATLNSDTSRPFKKPKSGRIAVKVINTLGDAVTKVFRVALFIYDSIGCMCSRLKVKTFTLSRDIHST